MWMFEHTVTAPASREQVWAVWTDVANWNVWDQDVAWAELDAAFAAGTGCTLKPKGGPKVRAVITRCDPPAGFTDESRLPLCKLVFDHRVADEPGGGVRITHRVSMTGATTFLFRRLVGRGIERGLPTAMRRLADLAASARPAAGSGGRA